MLLLEYEHSPFGHIGGGFFFMEGKTRCIKTTESLVLFFLCLSIAYMPLCGYAAGKIDTSGKAVEFKGVMSESIASQITAASDLTISAKNRSFLAAFLTLEFQLLINDDKTSNITLNLVSPIYVGKSGDMASVSFNTNKGYVLMIFQSKPLSTYYAFAGSSDSTSAKKALNQSSDQVWEVSSEELATAVTQLMGAIQ